MIINNSAEWENALADATKLHFVIFGTGAEQENLKQVAAEAERKRKGVSMLWVKNPKELETTIAPFRGDDGIACAMVGLQLRERLSKADLGKKPLWKIVDGIYSRLLSKDIEPPKLYWCNAGHHSSQFPCPLHPGASGGMTL